MNDLVIDNFIAAIDEEIRETRRRGGMPRIPVRSGKTRKTASDEIVCEFEMPDGSRIKEDSIAFLESGKDRHQGTVSKVGRRNVAITMDKDPGVVAEEGFLVIDECFILEKLKEVILDEGACEGRFDKEMALRVMENDARIVGGATDYQPEARLNKMQNLAVSKMLFGDLVFVWGPPGTGKTATMAIAVKRLFEAGLRILVVSNTNHAVDGILARICVAVSNGGVIDDGTIVRFGPTSGGENLKDVIVGEIAKRRRPGLFSEIDDIETRIVHAREAMARIERAAPEIGELASVLDMQRKLEMKGERPGEYLPTNAEGEGWRSLENRRSAICRRIDGDARLCGMRLDYETNRREIDAMRQRGKQISARIDETMRSLVDRAKIVATTAYQTFLKPSWIGNFDVVVIEEGSMLPLPIVYWVSGLAGRKVIVSGDFRQLPAVRLSRAEVVSEWFARDIFTKSGVEAAVRQGKLPENVVMLRDQYRMREEICGLINDFFYGGNLRTPEQLDRPFDARAFPSSVLAIDTTDLDGWTGYAAGSKSKYNPFGALIAAGLFDTLERRGYLDSRGRFGAITAYAAQSRLIGSLIGDMASTVHKYQGDERNTIVFDIAETGAMAPGIFYGSDGNGGIEGRLLNVALSRAKDHVVFVGDFGWIERRGILSGALAEIFGKIKKAARMIDGRTVISKGLNATRGARLIDPSETREDLEDDIDRARKSILLVSPRMSSGGLASFADVLISRRRSGVDVKIVVGMSMDDEGFHDPDAEERLREMTGSGIKVSMAGATLKERLAIIDERISWISTEGCLNQPRGQLDGMHIRIGDTAFTKCLKGLVIGQDGP